MTSVLHVYKTYLPDTIGGVQNVITNICENTPDIQTDVLSLSQTPTSGKLHPIMNHQAGSFKTSFEIASTPFSLEYIRKFSHFASNYDILHYHYPWPFMDLVHMSQHIQKPYIVTYHSDIIKQKFLLKLYQPFVQFFLQNAKKIIATSENYAHSSPYLKSFSPDIIPLGITKTHYPKGYITERIRPFIEDNKPFFLAIGVYRHYKGFDILPKIAPLIEANIIIGSAGKNADVLQEKIQKNNTNNIRLLKNITESEKIALLEHCTAFIFPSNNRAEAYGISLVEASMVGRAMISCEIKTGTSYVNKDGLTGLVIPPNDPQAFLHAMKFMLDHPNKAKEFGENAHKHFHDKLTGENMGTKYTDLYYNILSSDEENI